MTLDIDAINDIVGEVDSERLMFAANAREYIAMWELIYWTAEQRKLAVQEGRELAVDTTPRNVVNLASRLITNTPQISCPILDVTGVAENDAKARERFLRTLWQVQGNAQRIDPLSALKFNMLVPGLAAAKVLWVKDKLPRGMQATSPPIRIIPLDPTKMGIFYGDLYPKLAYHKIEQKARVVAQQYPDAKLFDGRKKHQYESNSVVTIRDVWWIDDDTGEVWQAVLLDDREFAIKPRKTEYTRLPIIERRNDPVPLAEEYRAANSILAPLREAWPIKNQLMSMHLTAVATHLWPREDVVNDENEEVPIPETGMGAFNQFPRGTRFLEKANSRPDIGLLQSLQQELQGQQVMSTFAPELYGKAPDTRTASYSLGMSMEAAQGRIKETVYQLERLMMEANELALCLVDHFSGSQGVTLYGYEQRNQSMFSATLTREQVMGAYQNTVSLITRTPADRLQQAALALQMVQAKVLSLRTVRRDYVPNEVPEDEEVQIMAEQVLNDPNLMAAIVKEAAALQGVVLPQGEPDWKDTPPPQMAQQQPQQQPMPQSVQQPDMALPQMPELSGGLTPEMMGQPQMAPQEFDMAMGQQVSPEQMLVEQLMQMGGPPQDMRARP